MKKVSSALTDRNPSYGMIFKQKRIGLEGRMIYTYKFRTMILILSISINSSWINRNSILREKSTKIRASRGGVGSFAGIGFDELPMIINFLQGDLKLIGVRPISLTFFNLYPEDLRELRINIVLV